MVSRPRSNSFAWKGLLGFPPSGYEISGLRPAQITAAQGKCDAIVGRIDGQGSEEERLAIERGSVRHRQHGRHRRSAFHDRDGVHVYSRLQGTSAWKFLARDTVPSYVDSTPLATAGDPEIREYRIRAVINDEEIGDYSDTAQLTVS